MFPSRVSYDVELICYQTQTCVVIEWTKEVLHGYLFMYLGAPILWCSKKQLVVALSTCDA